VEREKLETTLHDVKGGPGRCANTGQDLGTECTGGTQTMRPSSTAEPSQRESAAMSLLAASRRDYRRDRTHLFPVDEVRAAVAAGGTARSYCGIVQSFLGGDPTAVDEVIEPSPDDCVTCVDIWRGRTWVRL